VNELVSKAWPIVYGGEITGESIQIEKETNTIIPIVTPMKFQTLWIDPNLMLPMTTPPIAHKAIVGNKIMKAERFTLSGARCTTAKTIPLINAMLERATETLPLSPILSLGTDCWVTSGSLPEVRCANDRARVIPTAPTA